MTSEETRRRRHRNERIAASLLVLLAAAAAAVVWFVNRRLERETAVTTYIPKRVEITPEVELLQQYVRIDTSNPPGNEIAGARWLHSVLSRNGIRAEIIESAPGRGNVYARIEGQTDGEGLLLLNHIDVVGGQAEGWKRPPFSAEIVMDELHGRGTLDMKALGICQLLAFIDVAKSGRQPQRDLVFLAVADEEAGGTWGVQWLLKNRPDVVAGIRYAIGEGGLTEMQSEEVRYVGIEIGTKLRSTVVAAAPTREQLQRVRIALEPWIVSREPHVITPEVRRYFQQIAPIRTSFRTELADVDGAVARGTFWRLPRGYRELTQNLVWPHGVVRSGSQWEMQIDLFNLPQEDPEARLRWLREQLEPFGATIVKRVDVAPPVPFSREDTPFFAHLRREAAAQWKAPVGTKVLSGSSTDSRFLRPLGIEAYGMPLFTIDFFQSDSIHSVDERVGVPEFQEGIAFTRRLIRGWVFPDN